MHRFRLLPFIVLSIVILSGCSLIPSQTPLPSPITGEQTTSKIPDQPTPAGVELLKYSSMLVPETDIRVSWNGESATATFENGPMRGSVTQLPQFTQKMDDGTYVTYVAVNNGGSGELFYVATFANGEAMIEGKDTAFLGDRIQPRGLIVKGTTVTLDFMDHTPAQAMVEAPSVRVVRKFTVDSSGILTQVFGTKMTTDAQESSNIASPASENCITKGGKLTIAKNADGSEYGVCVFEDNRQCEEWALMRGQCPVGGVKVTGYEPNSEEYLCAIKGGTSTTNSAGEVTCVLPTTE